MGRYGFNVGWDGVFSRAFNITIIFLALVFVASSLAFPKSTSYEIGDRVSTS